MTDIDLGDGVDAINNLSCSRRSFQVLSRCFAHRNPTFPMVTAISAAGSIPGSSTEKQQVITPTAGEAGADCAAAARPAVLAPLISPACACECDRDNARRVE
jgi:hypothetical protein